jgi:HSP20 family protein
VLDPFGAPTSLGRLLALMEDAAGASGPWGHSFTGASPRRGWWVAKEDDDAVYLKVPMPGLGKEHVKVSAEQNSLVIKGEGEKDAWDGDAADAAVLRYSRRIELPANAYKMDKIKMDKIKAEMKNGVLRVTVPKLKKEERKDVFQVKIE